MEGEIVKLNVGGKRFYTTASTLTSHKSTFFDALLSGKFQTTKDELGCLFVDRDPGLFKLILKYLRTGKWRPPKDMDKEELKEELEFYGIEPSVLLSDASILQTWQQMKDQTKQDFLSPYRKEMEEIKDLIARSFQRCLEDQQKVLQTPRLLQSQDDIWKNWEPIESFQPENPTQFDVKAEKAHCKSSIKVILDTDCIVVKYFDILKDASIVDAIVSQIRKEFQLTVRLVEDTLFVSEVMSHNKRTSQIPHLFSIGQEKSPHGKEASWKVIYGYRFKWSGHLH